MSAKSTNATVGLLLAMIVLISLLAGCSLYYNRSSESASWVSIDAPLDGAQVSVNQEVPVVGRASNATGVDGMWLQVDGNDTLPLTIARETTDRWQGTANWIPGVPGNHELRIRAQAGEEVATSETIEVHVVAVFPLLPEPTSPATPTTVPLAVTPIVPTAVLLPTSTPIPTSTPWPTSTPVPTPTPQPSINFWADATTIPAGSCTTIHWETANIQAVFFDGQGVAGVDSRQVCPCTPQTHTLDVLLRDGSHDIRTLTINVTGSCFTPTPSQDTTPPPAPAPIGPGSNNPNDPAQQCGTTVLRWNSVSDPSGIQGYRVNLQWYDGSQWRSSEPYFIIYGTSADVTQWTEPHEYLHTLRWAVWAIDNAGNHGPQSPWLYFECVLE